MGQFRYEMKQMQELEANKLSVGRLHGRTHRPVTPASHPDSPPSDLGQPPGLLDENAMKHNEVVMLSEGLKLDFFSIANTHHTKI